jgi:hypothetical protein
MEDDRGEHDSRVSTFFHLAANFLSHLDPHSLTLIRELAASGTWRSVGVSRSAWKLATSGWNHLRNISFVNFSWLSLNDLSDLANPFLPFGATDLSGFARPISFSWTITEPAVGYAKVLQAWAEEDEMEEDDETEMSPIAYLTELLSKVWPDVLERGIDLDIGHHEVDRRALEKDLEMLPEQWNGLVRF